MWSGFSDALLAKRYASIPQMSSRSVLTRRICPRMCCRWIWGKLFSLGWFQVFQISLNSKHLVAMDAISLDVGFRLSANSLILSWNSSAFLRSSLASEWSTRRMFHFILEIITYHVQQQQRSILFIQKMNPSKAISMFTYHTSSHWCIADPKIASTLFISTHDCARYRPLSSRSRIMK